MLFVRFYQLLDEQMAGDEARMINWLRREQKALDSSPFYLIVDEGRLADMLAYLEQFES